MKKSIIEKFQKQVDSTEPSIHPHQLAEGFRSLGLPITPESSGRRVDEYLGANYLFLSRVCWKKRIKDLQVHVNNIAVRASYRLKVNDKITYYRPESEEPEVDKNIKVVWEYEGVLGVYKPSNLPMHEGGMFHKNTFSEVLRNEIGPEWAAVHRLDRETSGVVLCASTKELRNSLSAKLRERTMDKTYLAIGRGVPAEESWSIDKPIGEAKDTTFRLKKWVEDDGLPSLTHFKVLEKTEKHSLMQVSPKTGRTHQIRVHSAWHGLPLVGEKKYFPDETVYLEYLENGITDRVLSLTESKRLCLHATSLGFTHPFTNKECFIESPMPPDMKEVWMRLNPNSTFE